MAGLRLKSFDEVLYRQLQDPEFARAYLEDALSDSLDEFLIALGKYVQATKGMTRTAEEAHVRREAMSRMLCGKGNPGIRQLHAIMEAQGLQLHVG